jgi:hypothetical protein
LIGLPFSIQCIQNNFRGVAEIVFCVRKNDRGKNQPKGFSGVWVKAQPISVQLVNASSNNARRWLGSASWWDGQSGLPTLSRSIQPIQVRKRLEEAVVLEIFRIVVGLFYLAHCWVSTESLRKEKMIGTLVFFCVWETGLPRSPDNKARTIL